MSVESEGAGAPPAKKKSKLRRAWSIYSWVNRIRNAPDWYNWALSFLQTKAGVAAALGTVAAATTTAAVLVHDATIDVTPPLPIEVAAAPPPEAVRQTPGTLIFAIEGKDQAGRRGTFDVVVAKKEFLWVRGSSDEIEKEGRTIGAVEIAREVLDDEMRAALANAREIVAVGAASQEGDPREETERARRRAVRTAEIVGTAVAATLPISTLSLGQYREPCKECEAGGTNWQRPFMVIAVKELADGTNLGEALADALTGKQKLPSPKAYSAFELAKFR